MLTDDTRKSQKVIKIKNILHKEEKFIHHEGIRICFFKEICNHS